MTSFIIRRSPLLLAALTAICLVATTMASPILDAVAPEDLIADLNFVYSAVAQVHPKPYSRLSEKDYMDLHSRLKEKATHNLTRWEAYFLLNELVSVVGDGHTMLYYQGPQRRLPFILAWAHDGLAVSYTEAGPAVGDRVISMGGTSVDDILEQLILLIPAENIGWVKALGSARIATEPYLRRLGLIEGDSVTVEVEKADGSVRQYKVGLVESLVSPPVHPRVSYEIFESESLGVLYLNSCVFDDEFTSTVDAFFAALRDRGIKRMAIDVRRNTGGSSKVLDYILKYLPKDRVKGFDMLLRYSPQAAKERGYTKTSGYDTISPIAKLFGAGTITPERPQPKNLIFTGKVYVLTSPWTFSTANWIAVILRANGMATIVGEPTGNAPTSYGDAIGFTLPNTGHYLQVSHKKWTRPDTERDPEEALNPDIFIPRTVESIRLGTDPQLDAVKSAL